MSNPADCTIGASVQVKKYTTWFIVNHDVYVFTCTEAPIVESAGFDLWIIGLVLGIIVLIIVVFFISTLYRKRGGECPGK
jgi:uncharacterized membrane protein